MSFISDDPSTLFLLGVIATAIGFWIRDKIDAFTSANRKVEAKADRVNAGQSDIRVDLRELETKIDAFEKRLENHDRLQELVTRLDERVGGLVETINRQPQATAMTVAAAVTAAVKEVLATVRVRQAAPA